MATKIREYVEEFKDRIARTVNWAIEQSQIRDESNPETHGMYRTHLRPDGKWENWMAWTNSQMIQSLVKYYREEGDKGALKSALLNGEWFLRRQITSDDPRADGAYREFNQGDWIIVEPHHITLGGILNLYEATGDKRFLDSARRAFRMLNEARLRMHAREHTGMWDIYSVSQKRYGEEPGSVLILDYVWYRFYRIEKDNSLLDEFRAQCDEHMLQQYSDGSFYYGNSFNQRAGPRFSVYWSNFPNFIAYETFGDRKYLEVARRTCEWYKAKQNADGSFYEMFDPNGRPWSARILHAAWPYRDQRPEPPDVAAIDGHGVSAAIITWANYMRLEKEPTYVKECERSVRWLLRNQYRDDAEPVFRGAFPGHWPIYASTIYSSAFAIRAYYAVRDALEVL